MYEFTDKARTNFATIGGYDAVKSTNRRRAPLSIVQSEDDHARAADRKMLHSTARDIRRNFTLARWIVEKHLDFVVSHNFRAKTRDRGWKKELEAFVRWASAAERYDVRGFHSRRRFKRILEAGRVVDGDVFGVKLRGGFTQGIEADRCRDPEKIQNGERWVQGFKIGKKGAVQKYCFHKRVNRTRFQQERFVQADKVLRLGYYDRFDQYRGVSPLTPAINELRDLYEGYDYAKAREKVNQLFTFLITRDSQESFFDHDGDNVDSDKEPYEVDFSKGPTVLDLDPGDDARFLHTQGTPAESQEFWKALTILSLKCLNIPFSFYSEDFTNFFGSRSALILYLKSVSEARRDHNEYDDRWLRWRLMEGERNGEITLPGDFDIDSDFGEWIPDGIEWWNPAQEVKADSEAVANYFKTGQDVVRSKFGKDFFDVVDDRAEELAYIAEKGLPIPGGSVSAPVEKQDGEEDVDSDGTD